MNVRREVKKHKNRILSDEEHLKKSKKMIMQVNKSLKKLRELGINYSFRAVDDDNNLNSKIIQADISENTESKISSSRQTAKEGGIKKKIKEGAL